MRRIGWGLTAALFVAVLAPVAVFSAPKGAAPVSESQRKQGMAEAPAVAQAAEKDRRGSVRHHQVEAAPLAGVQRGDGGGRAFGGRLA